MSSRNILLLSVLLMGYLYWSLAQPMTVYEMLCTLRQAVDNPNECKFGFFTNICQKLECWKGPGEECGDNMSAYIRYGQCASGLICCNGECKGCINGICNSEPCHPPHSYQLRSDPHMMERRMDPLYRIFDHYTTSNWDE